MFTNVSINWNCLGWFLARDDDDAAVSSGLYMMNLLLSNSPNEVVLAKICDPIRDLCLNSVYHTRDSFYYLLSTMCLYTSII